MVSDFDFKPLDDVAEPFSTEEHQELSATLDAMASEAQRIARNQRRNRRKKIAKYLDNRGQEQFSGTQTMPRMRRVLRFLNKNLDQRISTAAGAK